MSTISSRAAAAAVFTSLLLAGSAYAQTPAPATSAAPAAKTTAAKTERSASSVECSTQADAKGLHGKERKKFRSKCKADAKKN